MKVISGTLKGRTIKGYNIDGTRPTMDRVKESLFAIIQNSIKDSVCLDLFAGSGNLGIEAVSNGAKLVYFVDNNNIAIKTIKENINTFNITEKCQVLYIDYEKALQHFKNEKIRFDLIFIDPPYKMNVLENILIYISNSNLLNDDGQVIIEHQLSLNCKYDNLNLIKNKRYNDKYISIFKKYV